MQGRRVTYRFLLSSNFLPCDYLQSAGMELKGTSTVGRTLEESGVPRCVSPFDQFGGVLIVSFVEETEGLLIFSSKYLG